MSGTASNFRDFGILPVDLKEPPATVRAVMPMGHVIGQYIATALMSCFGLGAVVLFAIVVPPPLNIPAALAPLLLFGFIVHRATRNDYHWVEFSGTVLRAKHLYTRRIVERQLTDVSEVMTLVFQVRNLSVVLVEHWLGRVRGVMIHFAARRTPLLVNRVDPSMRGAQELIEALYFRLSQRSDLEWEVINFAGQPLLRRVYVKS